MIRLLELLGLIAGGGGGLLLIWKVVRALTTTVVTVQRAWDVISHELSPNSGKSIADRVAATHAMVADIKEQQDFLREDFLISRRETSERLRSVEVAVREHIH